MRSNSYEHKWKVTPQYILPLKDT